MIDCFYKLEWTRVKSAAQLRAERVVVHDLLDDVLLDDSPQPLKGLVVDRGRRPGSVLGLHAKHERPVDDGLVPGVGLAAALGHGARLRESLPSLHSKDLVTVDFGEVQLLAPTSTTFNSLGSRLWQIF